MITRQFKNSAASLAALILLASCTNDDSQAQPDDSPGESTTNDAPEADYSVIGGQTLDGPGRWAMPADGDVDRKLPMAVWDVPEGFQGRESFVWTDEGAGRERNWGQVLYLAPNRVLADPCKVDEPSPPLGPTVEDFAAALVAQERTTATEPIPVELDGHRALYVELSSPAKFDYSACGEGGMLIFANENGDGGRGLELPWTDRYWIVDLDGQRVVITAGTQRGADNEAVELVTDVAEKTTFVDRE